MYKKFWEKIESNYGKALTIPNESVRQYPNNITIRLIGKDKDYKKGLIALVELVKEYKYKIDKYNDIEFIVIYK